MENIQKKQFCEAVIILTRNCNFNCKHCYVNKSQKNIGIAKIVDLVRILKKQKIKRVTLIGGEPMLYPFLKEVLFLLKDFKINITTNGSFFPSFIKKTKIKNISQITFSIQYFNQVKFNSFIRRKDIKITKILENLDHIKDLYPVGINVTILPDNQQDIKKIIDFAKKKRLKGVHLSPLFLSKNVKDNFNLKEVIFSKSLFSEFSKDKEGCSIDKKIVIDTDGEIYGCTALIDRKDLSVASVSNYSLEAHLKNIKNQKHICSKLCS